METFKKLLDFDEKVSRLKNLFKNVKFLLFLLVIYILFTTCFFIERGMFKSFIFWGAYLVFLALVAIILVFLCLSSKGKEFSMILKKIFCWEIVLIFISIILLVLFFYIPYEIFYISGLDFAPHSDGGKEQVVRYASTIKNYIILSFIGLLGILVKIGIDFNSYQNKLKEHDLREVIEKLSDMKNGNNFRIVIGYGQVGKQMIKQILKRAENNKNLKIKKTHWEEEKGIIHDTFVLEKDELKVPHVIAGYNTSVKIGYIDSKDLQRFGEPKKNSRSLIIPVLVGDARSRSVQELLAFNFAETVTFTTLSFRSNLSILDNWKTGEKKPRIILACRSHAERETYQARLIYRGFYPHEVIQVSEQIGNTLAHLVRAKLDYLDTGDVGKILIVGNYFLYSTVEAMFINNFIDFTHRINRDCRFVIMDSEKNGENCYAPNVFEIIKIFPYFRLNRLILQLFKTGKFSIWRPTFCRTTTEGKYENVQVEIPLIKGNTQNFMVSFIELWKPNLILLLQRRKEDVEKILHLILCHHRWNRVDKKTNSNYELIVSASGKETQLAAIQFLEQNFDIPYGAYSPTSTISRELTLLEKMFFES